MILRACTVKWLATHVWQCGLVHFASGTVHFFRAQEAEIGHFANLVKKQVKVVTWFFPARAKCEALGQARAGLADRGLLGLD